MLYLLASTTTAVPQPPQTPPPQSVAGIMAPASIGSPHQCDENQYPVSALQSAQEGATVLSFKITPQGSVRDAGVFESSGNSDLDSAAIACANQWQYRPALQNGAAVEVPWRARVVWRIAISEPFRGISVASFRCVTSTREGREELLQSTLHPVFKLHISNGTITSVTMLASSGNPDFDQRAAACYSSVPREATENLSGDFDETFVAMSSHD